MWYQLLLHDLRTNPKNSIIGEHLTELDNLGELFDGALRIGQAKPLQESTEVGGVRDRQDLEKGQFPSINML